MRKKRLDIESDKNVMRYAQIFRNFLLQVVVHEESTDRNCLFLVLSGCVSVSQK